MMDKLRSNIAMLAHNAANSVATARIGVVSSYDPNTYSVKVKLQPPDEDGKELESGWLPIWSPWVGDRWGFFAPPKVDDQVLVVFIEGDIQQGICIGALFSDVDEPLAVQSKEFWIVHETGSSMKFTNDGSVLLNTHKDLVATVTGKLDATVNGDANITIKGDINSSAQTWSHDGDVNVTGTVTASTDVVGGGKSLKDHTHSGVTAGSDDTGPPV